jgi:hypothetical protein
MKKWERENYTVLEIEHDHSLHAFEIIQGEEVKHTIYPGSISEMESIKEDLDAGEDVEGWEDGMGNTIRL